MSDETAAARDGEDPRPFASYTPADHARVAMAANAMFLAGLCHQAIIPERYASEDVATGTAGIRAALAAVERARNLLESAVISAYESGLTWEQIGRALRPNPGPGGEREGITRQSAHTRYAPAVAEFREQLAAAIARADHDQDPGRTGPARVCDTGWYAPYLDKVTATVEHPGMLAPTTKPGEFLGRLSDPDTAAPAHLGGVRGPDTPVPQCSYTEQLAEPYLDDGMYGWLVCTLREGHPGSRHQLAVTTEE